MVCVRQMVNGTGRVRQVRERESGTCDTTCLDEQDGCRSPCLDLDVLAIHILVETIGDSGSSRLIITVTHAN